MNDFLLITLCLIQEENTKEYQTREEKQTAREQLGPSETSYAVTIRAQVQQQKTQTEKYKSGEQFLLITLCLIQEENTKEYQTREEKQTAREQLGPSETSYAVTIRAQVQQQKTQKKNTIHQ